MDGSVVKWISDHLTFYNNMRRGRVLGECDVVSAWL